MQKRDAPLYPALMAKLDEVQRLSGWSDSYLGKRAANNSPVIGSLRNGGDCRALTRKRLEDFATKYMQDYAARVEK